MGRKSVSKGNSNDGDSEKFELLTLSFYDEEHIIEITKGEGETTVDHRAGSRDSTKRYNLDEYLSDESSGKVAAFIRTELKSALESILERAEKL